MNQNKFSKTFTQFKNNINSKTKEKNKLFLKKKKLFYLNKNKNINKEKYNTINISENNTLNNNKKIKFNTMIFTQDLMKKIKTEQKETKNKLIKNINNKNMQNVNIINFMPIFNKVFEKKINIKKNEKKQNQLKIECKTEKIDKTKFENKKIINADKIINKNVINIHKKINSQENLISLLNNFTKEKDKKKNKSIYNFGNIFFINQIRNQFHKNAETEIYTKNGIKMQQKPKIITNFSNYKKKIKTSKLNLINSSKRFNTENNLDSV